jgi:hypothetical protein
MISRDTYSKMSELLFIKCTTERVNVGKRGWLNMAQCRGEGLVEHGY